MLESFKQVVNRNRWLFDFKFVNESKMTHHTINLNKLYINLSYKIFNKNIDYME